MKFSEFFKEGPDRTVKSDAHRYMAEIRKPAIREENRSEQKLRHAHKNVIIIRSFIGAAKLLQRME